MGRATSTRNILMHDKICNNPMRFQLAQLPAASRTVIGAFRLSVRLRKLRWHFRVRRAGKDMTALVAVLILHMLFLVIMLWGLRVQTIKQTPVELQLMLGSPGKVTPARPPEIALPALPVEAPPDIVVESESSQSVSIAAASTIVLPPRPDPKHPNLPFGVSGATGITTLVLKILVQPDGTVSDAKIVTSSEHPEVDAEALEFVKSNWRFRAAVLGGVSIPYWTTIHVPMVVR